MPPLTEIAYPRLMARVREHLGVTGFDATARRVLIRASFDAARRCDDPADIVNCAIEELVRQRFELPALGTLLRAARSARAIVNRGYLASIHQALDPATRTRLQELLAVKPGQTRTPWDAVKADAPPPSPHRMKEFLTHLDALRDLGAAPTAFAGVPELKLGQFALEARSLHAAALGQLTEPRRLALIACFLRRQVARALDDAAEMFIRQMQRLHNRAREALARHQAQWVEQTDSLIALLREAVVACRGEGSPQERFEAVTARLTPQADAILAQCDAHAAVAFLLEHADSRSARLTVVRWERPDAATPTEGGKRAVPRVDLSFIPDKWWEPVTGHRNRDDPLTTVDRRSFELCLFTQILQELRSGDLCLPGSESYGDYREQLVSWEEYRQQIGAFSDQAGVAVDGAASRPISMPPPGRPTRASPPTSISAWKTASRCSSACAPVPWSLGWTRYSVCCGSGCRRWAFSTPWPIPRPG